MGKQIELINKKGNSVLESLKLAFQTIKLYTDLANVQ